MSIPPSSRPRFAVRLAPLLALILLPLLGACDRNVEPYTDDPVAQPDLSRIFPEGAERAADEAGPPTMPVPAGSPRGGGPARPAGRGATAFVAVGAPLRGTLEVSDELADQVPTGAILFVIARSGAAGPPTAVLRIPAPEFPLAFEIGPGDRMIETMPFEGPFQLTARVDADGNAMTRNPGDLEGAAEGSHMPGSDGIRILIDRIQ